MHGEDKWRNYNGVDGFRFRRYMKKSNKKALKKKKKDEKDWIIK